MALSTRLATAWLTSSRLATRLRPFGDGDLELQAGLLGDRLVQLGDVADDGCRIDRRHALGDRAALEARDQQQRVEGLDQLVGLLDGLDEAVAVGGGAVGVAQRRLGAVAQAVERRLEVVGDVVGHLAQGAHQLLDARQHGVEALRQAVELVAGAVERDAPGEIAGHDGAAGVGDGLDAAQHAAADQRGRRRRRAATAAPTLHSATWPMVSANRRWSSMSRPTTSMRPPGTAHGHADGQARGAAAPLGRARVAEHAAAGRRCANSGGTPVEVAGDLAAGGVDQQVEAGAGLAGALGDDGAQARGAAGLELLAQAGDLGVQRLDHLGGEQLVGAPGDEADDQRRRHARTRPCRRASGGTASS